MDEIYSLGAYIECAKLFYPEIYNQLRNTNDYHSLLQNIDSNNVIRVHTVAFFLYNNKPRFVNISNINLSDLDFCDILAQINSGISISNLAINANNTPQSFFTKYLENLGGDNNTKFDVNEIMNRINQLTSDPSNRDIHKNGFAKGLAVGRVQSGKTRNYTGLITKAIDEGWNIIIVLTSCNIALTAQTLRRLKNELQDAGLHTNKLFFNDFGPSSHPTEIDPSIQNNYRYITVAKKHTNDLKSIHDWLSRGAEKFQNDMNVFIIDDESDNATPDTQAGKNQLSEEDLREFVGTLSTDYPECADWLDKTYDLREDISFESIQENYGYKTQDEVKAHFDQFKTDLNANGLDINNLANWLTRLLAFIPRRQ